MFLQIVVSVFLLALTSRAFRDTGDNGAEFIHGPGSDPDLNKNVVSMAF